jgi:DNA-binding beta-propeller fold protein YncE
VNGIGGTPKTAFYRHEKPYEALLKIEGKTVRKVAQAEVSDLAEGIAFSPDGRYLYVGNFVDGNIDILRLDGDALTKVASFALPGHSASMRGEHPLSPPLRSPHALTRRIKSAQRSSTGSVLSAGSGRRVTTTRGGPCRGSASADRHPRCRRTT